MIEKNDWTDNIKKIILMEKLETNSLLTKVIVMEAKQ